MSDYLWDKTGEVDEEAERLEELLVQFRFQPRTFEVPATLPILPRRAPRKLDAFSWRRLAVAASVLLALLAGTWLVLKRQPSVGTQVEVAHDKSKGVPAPTQEQQPRQSNQDQLAPAPPELAVAGGEEKSVSNRPRAAEFLNASLKRRAARRRQPTGRSAQPREELADLTPQEKEAMELFLLAMKVTSEKLSYAQQQVAGLNDK